jgi:hypothetical protein
MSIHTHKIVDGIEIPLTEEEIAYFESKMLEAQQNAAANQWILIREQRDQILASSDILVLPDRWAGYTKQKQTAIATYRQALRDLPETQTDPFNIVWPTAPN